MVDDVYPANTPEPSVEFSLNVDTLAHNLALNLDVLRENIRAKIREAVEEGLFEERITDPARLLPGKVLGEDENV